MSRMIIPEGTGAPLSPRLRSCGASTFTSSGGIGAGGSRGPNYVLLRQQALYRALELDLFQIFNDEPPAGIVRHLQRHWPSYRDSFLFAFDVRLAYIQFIPSPQLTIFNDEVNTTAARG